MAWACVNPSRVQLWLMRMKRETGAYGGHCRYPDPPRAQLYINDDIGLDLANTVYALDSTTIDVLVAISVANFVRQKPRSRCTRCLICVSHTQFHPCFQREK